MALQTRHTGFCEICGERDTEQVLVTGGVGSPYWICRAHVTTGAATRRDNARAERAL